MIRSTVTRPRLAITHDVRLITGCTTGGMEQSPVRWCEFERRLCDVASPGRPPGADGSEGPDRTRRRGDRPAEDRSKDTTNGADTDSARRYGRCRWCHSGQRTRVRHQALYCRNRFPGAAEVVRGDTAAPAAVSRWARWLGCGRAVRRICSRLRSSHCCSRMPGGCVSTCRVRAAVGRGPGRRPPVQVDVLERVDVGVIAVVSDEIRDGLQRGARFQRVAYRAGGAGSPSLCTTPVSGHG